MDKSKTPPCYSPVLKPTPVLCCKAMRSWCLAFLVALFLFAGLSTHVHASPAADIFNANMADIDALSTGTTGPMAELMGGLEGFLKDFAKLMAGPVAMAGILAAIVVVFGGWVLAPKTSILGPGIRVMVAGIALVNSTDLINAISGFFT